MAKYEDLALRILRGGSDANIRFADLRHLLRRLGFAERVRGVLVKYHLAGGDDAK